MGFLWSKSCSLAIVCGVFTAFSASVFCDNGTSIYGLETESKNFYLGKGLYLTNIDSRPDDYGYLQVYDDISTDNDKLYEYSKIYSYAAELCGQVYASNPVSAIFLNYTPLKIENDKLPYDWPAQAVSTSNISRITNTQNNRSISVVSLNKDLYVSQGFKATLRLYTDVTGGGVATLLAANKSNSGTITYDDGNSAASVFDLHTPSSISLELQLQGSPKDITSRSVNLTSYAAASTVAVSSSIGGASLAMSSGDQFNIVGKSVDLGNGAYISSEAIVLSKDKATSSAVSSGIGAALYGCGEQANTIYNVNNFGTNIGTNGVVFSLATSTAGEATSVGVGNAIDKIKIASQVVGGIGNTKIGFGTTVAAYSSGNNSTAVGIGSAITNITDTKTVIPLTCGNISIGQNSTIVAANVQSSQSDTSTAVGIGCVSGENKMTGGSIIFNGPADVVAISNGAHNKSVAIGCDVKNATICFNAYSGGSKLVNNNIINLIALNGAITEPSSGAIFSLANSTLSKSISLSGDSKIIIGGVYNPTTQEIATSSGNVPIVNIYGGIENAENSTSVHVVNGATTNMYGVNAGVKSFIIDSATVNLRGSDSANVSNTISIPSISELNAGKRKMKDLTMQFTPTAASLTIDNAGSFSLKNDALFTLGNVNRFSYGGVNGSRSANSEIQINSLGNLAGGLEPSTFLEKSGQFYGLYSKTSDEKLLIDNILGITGTSVFKVGSANAIKITGTLAFIGDNCATNFVEGAIVNQKNSSYEFRNMSHLTLSNIYRNFANLYETESLTNLDINNKFILSHGSQLKLVSGDLLNVSGILVIDEAGLIPVKIDVGIGATFSHTNASTFAIKNVANLDVSQFANGKKYGFLYNLGYNSDTKKLTIDNTLAFGGETTMSFSAGQSIDIEKGSLCVLDKATLALDGSSADGSIIGSNKIIHHPTTTFKINNLVSNLKMSDFTTGKYKTLYDKLSDQGIIIDNALKLQDKTLNLGAGDTIVFRDNDASFYSNAAQSSAQNVTSRYIFLNTIVNADNFGTGSSDITRFHNLNKNSNAIENNVIVGDAAGTTPSTFCINKTNFALKTGAKLAINDGSTLKFSKNGSSGSTVDATISATAGQVTHTRGSIFEFSGVTKNLQVSKFKTNSTGGYYYNLYSEATSTNLPIDNTVKLSSQGDYNSLFNVDGTLDISKGQFIVEEGATLLFSNSINSKIIGAETALKKSQDSIISLGSSFTVPNFISGNLSNVYKSNDGIVSVDNILDISSGGKFTVESGYGANFPVGSRLSLTSGTLSLINGNKGINLVSSDQVTKSTDSICEFKNIALLLNDFVSGGKYSNLYRHDDVKKILSIDNVFKLTTDSGITPPASFTLNSNETLSIVGTLSIGNGSAVTVNSGAMLAFRGDEAKLSKQGTITLDPNSTTILDGRSNVTLSSFATNGALAGLYSVPSNNSLNINNILKLSSYDNTMTTLTVGSGQTITSFGLHLNEGSALKLNNNSKLQVIDASKVSHDASSSITFNNVNLQLSMFGNGGNYQNLFLNNKIDNKVYLNGGSLTIDQPLTFVAGGVLNLGSNAKINVSGSGAISGGDATTFVMDESSTCIFKKDFNIADFYSDGKYYGLYISEKEEKDLSLTINNKLEVAADGKQNTTFQFKENQSAIFVDGGKLKIGSGSTLLFNKGSYFTGSANTVSLDKTSICKFCGVNFGDNAAELFFDNSNKQNYFLGLYSVPSVNAFTITNKIDIGDGSVYKIGQNNIVTVSGENAAFVVSANSGTKSAMESDNFLYYPNVHLHNALNPWDVRDEDRKSTFVIDQTGVVSIKQDIGRKLINIVPYADSAAVVPQNVFDFFWGGSLFHAFGRGNSDEYIDNTEDESDVFIGNILKIGKNTTLVIDGKIGVGYSLKAAGLRYEYVDIHGKIIANNGGRLKFVGDGGLVFNSDVKNDILADKKDKEKTKAHNALNAKDDFTYYSPNFNYSFFDVDVGSICEFDGIGDFGIQDFVCGSCCSTGTGVKASLDYYAKRFSTLYDVDLVVPKDLGFMVALQPTTTMTVKNKMILSASTAGKPICFVLELLNLNDDKGMYGYGKSCSVLKINSGAGIHLGGDNDKASKGLKIIGSKLYETASLGTDQTVIGTSSQWLTVKEYDPNVAENYVEFNNVGTFNLNDIGGSGNYGYIFQDPNTNATIPSLTFKLTGDSILSLESGHIGFKGKYSRLSAGADKITFTKKSNGTSDAIIDIIDRGDFSTNIFGTELQQLFSNTNGKLAIDKTLKLSGSSRMSVDNDLNITGGLHFKGSGAYLKGSSGAITLDPTSNVTFSGVGEVHLARFGKGGKYEKLFGDVNNGVNINNNVKFLSSIVASQVNSSILSIKSGTELNVGASGLVNIGKYCKIDLSGKTNLSGTLLFSEQMATSDECRFRCIATNGTAVTKDDAVGMYLAPDSKCKFDGLGQNLMPSDFLPVDGKRFAGLYPMSGNVMSITNTLVCANNLSATNYTKLDPKYDVTFSVLSKETIKLQENASLQILNCSKKYGLFFENNSCGIFENGSSCKNGAQVSRQASSMFKFVDYADLKVSDFVSGGRFGNLYDVRKESGAVISSVAIDNKLYLQNSKLTIDENYSETVEGQLLGDKKSELIIDKSKFDIADGAIFTIGTIKFIGNDIKQPSFTNEGRYFSGFTNIVFHGDQKAYEVKSSDFKDKLQVAYKNSGGKYVLSNLTAFENSSSFTVNTDYPVIINSGGCLAFSDNCNLTLNSGSTLNIDGDGYLLFNGISKIAQNAGTITLDPKSEVILSNTGQRSWDQFITDFSGLYSKTNDTFKINNVFALEGHSTNSGTKITLNSDNKININGTLRFIGNESGLITNGGTVSCASTGAYEFKHISVNLKDFKIDGKYSALYTDKSYWPGANQLNIDNHIKIFGAAKSITINGQVINVPSGSFTIDNGDQLNVVDGATFHLGDGIDFTCNGTISHTTNSTFVLDGYKNLILSDFVSSGKFKKFYGEQPVKQLSIDNTLCLGGDTYLTIAADEYVNLEHGILELADSAYLKLNGAGKRISDYKKLIVEPNTTVELADAGKITLSSFSTQGNFDGLFTVTDKTLPISNTLYISGTSSFTVGAGETLQFSGDQSRLKSDKETTKTSDSTISFLNTTVNSSDFYKDSQQNENSGQALNRFACLYKESSGQITIDNNFSLGVGSTLIIEDGDSIYISGLTGATGKLSVGNGSTLRFEGEAKISNIDLGRARIAIDDSSVTEFAGVVSSVSDFINGKYPNLYSYKNNVVTCNNSISFLEGSSFKVNTGYGVNAKQFKLGALSTLTIDGASNNVSFNVNSSSDNVTRSKLSSIELINFANGNLGVSTFESGGILANLYPVEEGTLSIDNKLCLCGKIFNKSVYSYPSTFVVAQGKKLSLGRYGRLGMGASNSKLIFQSGNNGFSAENYYQLQVDSGAIYEFNGDVALADSAFVSGGKYANIFLNDDSNITIGNQVDFKSTGMIFSNKNLIVDGVSVTFDDKSSFTLSTGKTLTLNSDVSEFIFSSGSANLADNSTVVLNCCGDLNLNSFTSNSSKYKGLFAVNSENNTFNTGANIKLCSTNSGSYNFNKTTLTIAPGEAFSMYGLSVDEHCKVTINETGSKESKLQTIAGVTGNIIFNGVEFSTDDFEAGKKFQNLISAGPKACTLILDDGTCFTDKNKDYNNPTKLLSGSTFVIDKSLATTGLKNTTDYSTFVERNAGSIFKLSGSNDKPLKVSTLSLCTGEDDNAGSSKTNDNIGVLYKKKDSGNFCDVNNSLYLTNVNLRIGGTGNGITACGLNLSGSTSDGIVGSLILADKSQLLFDANSVITGYKKNEDYRLSGVVLADGSATTFYFDGMPNMNFSLFKSDGKLAYIYGVNIYDRDGAADYYNVTIDNCMQLTGGSKFTVGPKEQVTFSGANAALKVDTSSSVDFTENYFAISETGGSSPSVQASSIVFDNCGIITMQDIIATNSAAWPTHNRFNTVVAKEVAHKHIQEGWSNNSYSGGDAVVLSAKYSFGKDSILKLEHQDYQDSKNCNTIYMGRFYSESIFTTGSSFATRKFEADICDITFKTDSTLQITGDKVSLGFPCIYNIDPDYKTTYFYKCARDNNSTFEFNNVGKFEITQFNCDTDEAKTIAERTNDLQGHCKTTLKYGGLYYNVSDTTSAQTVVANPYVSNESTIAGSDTWMLRVDNILKLSGNSTLNITSKTGSASSGMLDLTGNTKFPNKGKLVIAGTSNGGETGESCLLVSSKGIVEIGEPSSLKADGSKDPQAELWIGNNIENIDMPKNGTEVAIPSYNAVIEFDYGSKFVGPSKYSGNTTEGNIFKMPGSTCRFKPVDSGTANKLTIDSFLPGAHSVGDSNYYLGIYNAYTTTVDNKTIKTIEIDNKLDLSYAGTNSLQFLLNSDSAIVFVGNFSGIRSNSFDNFYQTPIVCDTGNSLGAIAFNGVGELSAYDFQDGRFSQLLYHNYYKWQVGFASLTLQDGSDQYLEKGTQTFKLADASVSTILVKNGETLPLTSCKNINLIGDSRIYGETGATITIAPTTAISISTNGSADITMFANGTWEKKEADNESANKYKYAGLYGTNFTSTDTACYLNIINNLLIKLSGDSDEFNVFDSHTVDVKKSLTIDGQKVNIARGGNVIVEPGATFIVKNAQLNVNGKLTVNGDLYFSGQPINTNGEFITNCFNIFEGSTVAFGSESSVSFGEGLNLKSSDFCDKAPYAGLFVASDNNNFVIKADKQTLLYKSYKIALGQTAEQQIQTLPKTMRIRSGGSFTLMMGDILELGVNANFIAEDGTRVVADKLSTIKITNKDSKLQLPTYVDEKIGFTKSHYSILDFAYDNCSLNADSFIDNGTERPKYHNVYSIDPSNNKLVIDNYLKLLGSKSLLTIDVPTKITGRLFLGNDSSLIINATNNISNLSFDESIVLSSNLPIGSSCVINGFNFDTRDLLTSGKLKGLYYCDGNSVLVNNNLSLTNGSFVIYPGQALKFTNCDKQTIKAVINDTAENRTKPLFKVVNPNQVASKSIVSFLLSSDYTGADIDMKFSKAASFTYNGYQDAPVYINMIDVAANSELYLESESRIKPSFEFNVQALIATANIGINDSSIIRINNNYFLKVDNNAAGKGGLSIDSQVNIGNACCDAFSLSCNNSEIYTGDYSTFNVTANSYSGNKSSIANIGLAGSNISGISSIEATNWVVGVGDNAVLSCERKNSSTGNLYKSYFSRVNIGVAESANASIDQIKASGWKVTVGDNAKLGGANATAAEFVCSSANIGIAASSANLAKTVIADNWIVNIGDGSTLSGANVGIGVSVNGSEVPSSSSNWSVSGWNVTVNGSCNIITAGENSKCFGGENAKNWTVTFAPSANNEQSIVNLVSVNGVAQYNNDTLKITTAGDIREALNDVFDFDNSSKIIVGDSESESANTVKLNILGNASIICETCSDPHKDTLDHVMLLRRNGIVNIFGGTLKLDNINLYLSGKINLLGIDKLSQEGLLADLEDSSIIFSRLGLPELSGSDAAVGKIECGSDTCIYFGASFAGKNEDDKFIIKDDSALHISVDEGAKVTLPKNLSFRFFDAKTSEVADVNNIYIEKEGISILSVPNGINIGDVVNIDGVPIDEYYSANTFSGEYFQWEGLHLSAKSNSLILSTSENGAVRKPNEKALKISKLDHIINMNKLSIDTMLSSIEDRVNDLKKSSGAYLRVVGGAGHANFGSGCSNYNSVGFVVGCDGQTTIAEDLRYLRYGLALSGIKSDADITAITDSKLNVRTLQCAGYCAYESYDNSGKKFDASLTIGYAKIDDNMERHISSHSFNNKFKNDVVFASASLMQSIYSKNNWQIGPKASLTFYHLSQGALDKKGIRTHELSLSNMSVNIVDGVLSLSAKKDIKYDVVRNNSITFYGDFGAKLRLHTGVSNVKCVIDSLSQFKPYMDSVDKIGFVGSVGASISIYDHWNIFGQCNASITKKTADYSFCTGVGYEF